MAQLCVFSLSGEIYRLHADFLIFFACKSFFPFYIPMFFPCLENVKHNISWLLEIVAVVEVLKLM